MRFIAEFGVNKCMSIFSIFNSRALGEEEENSYINADLQQLASLEKWEEKRRYAPHKSDLVQSLMGSSLSHATVFQQVS